MRIVFVFLALLLSLHATPVLAQKKTAKPAVKRTYISRKLGIAFNRPAEWMEGTDVPTPNMIVGFTRRGEDIYQGTIIFLGTITVSLQRPSASAASASVTSLPPNFAETLDAEYKKILPEYVLAGTAKFKVAGEPAVSIAFQARDERAGIIGRIRQVWVLHDKKLWLFTLKGRLDEFDRYVEDFNKMMASVQWLSAK